MNEILSHKFTTKPYQNDGSYVWFKAIKFNNLEKIKQLLSYNRQLLWEFDHSGQNCIHLCVRKAYSQLLGFLLEEGGDYELRDGDGKTPIHYVRDFECFRLLSVAGAQPW